MREVQLSGFVVLLCMAAACSLGTGAETDTDTNTELAVVRDGLSESGPSPLRTAGPARAPSPTALAKFTEARERAADHSHHHASPAEMADHLARYENAKDPRARQEALIQYFAATYGMPPQELEEAKGQVIAAQKRMGISTN